MDRDRDRDRDRRYVDRERDRTLGGESYRPTKHPDNGRRPSRSPPIRSGAFRPNRPSQRRSRSPAFDTYVPPSRAGVHVRSRSPVSFRRRSRSPPPPQRERERSPLSGARRGRERSPARRPSPRRISRTRDTPLRRDERVRSPPRNTRARSPHPLKREREPSLTGNRGGRSPPPFKRERYNSPTRGGYDRPRSPPRRPFSPHRGRRSPPSGPKDMRMRSRSPIGDDRNAHQGSASWRARSISPMRPNHSGQTSGKESGNTSRRSSPPIHPSRLALQQTETRSPPSFPSSGGRHHLLSAPRSPAARSPRRDRDRSPPRRVYSPRRSPPRGPAGYRSPPRRGYSPPPTRGPAPQRNGNGVNGPSNHFSTPTGNSHRNDRNDHQKEIPRAPPTGPSRNFSSSAMISPPSGPASTPISMSAHNRLGSQSVLSAPTHPRGTPSSGPPSQRSGNFSGPPPSGPRRGPPPLITRDSPRASPATPTPTASSPGANGSQSASIPTGPRAPPPSARAPHLHPHSSGTFRSGHHNSTSTTYPRTQRFNPHLSALPSIVPGGKLFPPNSSGGDPAISERLSKLQQEQQKIEKELAEKLEKKRKSVRQWERLDRESAREGLKGELAEKQVRMMAGEGGLGGAAF